MVTRKVGFVLKTAQAIDAKIYQSILENDYFDIDRLHFYELCDWYMDRKYNQNTKSQLKSIKPFFDKEVRKITLSDFDNLIQNSGGSKATINKRIGILNGMLKYALNRGKIKKLPCLGVYLSVDNKRNVTLLKSQIWGIIDNIEEQWLKEIVIMAAHMPMRKSEILNLTWDRVSIHWKVITLLPQDTKNKKPRKIPIHPVVLDMFKNMGNDRRTVFKNVSVTHLRNQLAKYTESTFHEFRYYAINELRLAGNSERQIMEWAGHKNRSMFDRYTYITEQEIKEVKWAE